MYQCRMRESMRCSRSQSANEMRSRSAVLFGEPHFHRDGELAGRAECVNLVLETAKLIAILLRESDRRLDSLLPAAVEKQPFLRSEAEIALVPFAIFQHAQIFEELANVDRLAPGTGT